jgi:2'-5' RNA ligase
MDPSGKPGGGPRHGRGGRGFVRPADDPPGTSRLFIAVPVADEVREAVAGLMRELSDGPIELRAPGRPRWVSVEGLHLTLRFLGVTPDERVPELAAVLAAVARGVEPFHIELRGGGAFPSPSRPRVLWIGVVAGEPELARLTGLLSDELSGLGWPRDDRPLQAHLTLARTDGVPGSEARARRLIELARDLSLGWRAENLVLYRSHVGRGPSRYDVVTEARLG